MALHFKIENNLAIYTAIGDVEFHSGLEVLKAGLEEVIAHPDVNNVLFDLRDSEENRSVEEVKGIAQVVKSRLVNAKLAVVAKKDIQYGFGRMFSLLIEDDFEVYVFKDYDEAIDWLNS